MSELVKHTGGALALSEGELLQVLQSSLYPGAAMDSIKLVIGYCKAAGLDPMQKPVHIVPMWDAKAGRMRDVVMPGVNLYRTQASRSGQFAGMSEPEFGPSITETIGGQAITFPEWCRVTVKRALANGVLAEFTAREFWMENYAVKGGKEKSIAPNAMWTKRPRGQIAKCAAAQALRIAFPEIASQPTADEMEGKSIDGTVIDGSTGEVIETKPAPPPLWPDDAFSTQFPRWNKAVSAGMKTADDILALARSKGSLTVAQEASIRGLKAPQQNTTDDVDPFVAEMEAAEREGAQ